MNRFACNPLNAKYYNIPLTYTGKKNPGTLGTLDTHFYGVGTLDTHLFIDIF
jgi:hypothetical protein